MRTAEFVKAYQSKYEKYRSLVYRYRGYEYTIYDYGMTGIATLKEQHQMEQNRIDRDIEINSKHTGDNGTSTAQDAFDFFWEYVNN